MVPVHVFFVVVSVTVSFPVYGFSLWFLVIVFCLCFHFLVFCSGFLVMASFYVCLLWLPLVVFGFQCSPSLFPYFSRYGSYDGFRYGFLLWVPSMVFCEMVFTIWFP